MNHVNIRDLGLAAIPVLGLDPDRCDIASIDIDMAGRHVAATIRIVLRADQLLQIVDGAKAITDKRQAQQ